jgi:hypothetical protein
MRALLFAILALLAHAHVARAGWHCSAPLADWQPRDALVVKLEAEGWRDVAIRVDDGCYLVHAGNAAGEKLHGKFDPATLTPIRDEGKGHHHEGDGRRRDSED